MKSSLTIRLSKSFGVGGILDIELSAERMIDEGQGLAEFDLLIDRAERMFEHFNQHRLPHMTALTEVMKQTQTLPALKATLTLDKGKRYCKILTHGYEEHGIPFWSEHMTACGLNPKTFPPDEGYTFKPNTMMEVEIVNGKPKKVLKLIAEKK
jgi:hypothetical protein